MTKAPPIKIQGIKTKLVPFIKQNIVWTRRGTWIEPFVGSGSVLFNLAPDRALVGDTNQHVISFYNHIQKGEITPEIARSFLEEEGSKLLKVGEAHYYRIRERFNAYQAPLDFLFLNRSCFNGLMRFNKSGGLTPHFVVCLNGLGLPT